MTSPRILIHAGFHKTGSTSIQDFLGANRKRLAEENIHFFEGRHLSNNHVELHVAAMRDGRSSPYKWKNRLSPDRAYRASVRRDVCRFLSEHDGLSVFSSEGISYLRYPDEVAWLAELLPTAQVVFYLRDREAYRRSHAAQFAKQLGLRPLLERDDTFSLEPDGWLLDFDSRLAPFRQVFGGSNVLILDYDEEMTKTGNVIPSMLQLIGARKLFDVAEWSSVHANRTEQQQ